MNRGSSTARGSSSSRAFESAHKCHWTASGFWFSLSTHLDAGDNPMRVANSSRRGRDAAAHALGRGQRVRPAARRAGGSDRSFQLAGRATPSRSAPSASACEFDFGAARRQYRGDARRLPAGGSAHPHRCLPMPLPPVPDLRARHERHDPLGRRDHAARESLSPWRICGLPALLSRRRYSDLRSDHAPATSRAAISWC